MAAQKLTPEEFREDFGGAYMDDFTLAHEVVQCLDPATGASLVQAARAFLEAQRLFDEALVAAGIRHD